MNESEFNLLLERRMLEEALRQCKGCTAMVAHHLGWHVSVVERKLSEHKLDGGRFAESVREHLRLDRLPDSACYAATGQPVDPERFKRNQKR